MSKKSMLLLQAAACLGKVYRDTFDSDYRRREEVRRNNERNRKPMSDHFEQMSDHFKRIAEKEVRKQDNERRLRKFTVNGNEIEAYSRKDAIKRLKHIGLL